MNEVSIQTFDLTKIYDNKLRAVDDLNLEIPKGKLFGFLGPNGAGKSTSIKMLATVLTPTSGTAEILGHDITEERSKVRELIGVCPQDLVFWEKLTAKENIHLIAQMHNIHPADYKEKTDELLGKMKLLERGDDQAKTFSGGMKRRLNVLMAVIHEPEVIFFDEPSAGLDPQSRRVVWDFIRDFEKENKTVILTTHNMEEADDLSDELVIIDHGKIIAQGTPQDLKGKIGTGDIIEFHVPPDKRGNRKKMVKFLSEREGVTWAKELGKERIVFSSLDGLRNISHFYALLEEQFDAEMQDLMVRQNTLEDVFIDLTGRELRN